MSRLEQRGNGAEDVFEMTYGYNAKGELVHKGKYITPGVMAGMDLLQQQKDLEAQQSQEIDYDVEEVTVATGELYKPEV